MPFTLAPAQSEQIKAAVRGVMADHAISDHCGEIGLFPDTDIEGDDILHIVIVLNGEHRRGAYERADATVAMLNHPAIREAKASVFPVPHFVNHADYPKFKASLVNAPF